MTITNKGVMPYDPTKTPSEDIEANKEAFGNTKHTKDIKTLNNEGAKPAVEGEFKPANMAELMTPIETKFQSTGKVWGKTHPKSGK